MKKYENDERDIIKKKYKGMKERIISLIVRWKYKFCVVVWY